jgi:RNA-directed DNA polymerase
LNYHAVPGNMGRLDGFLREAGRAWRQALLRRSQRKRMPWSRFKGLLRQYLPPCRVVHPHPAERFRVNTFGKSRMQ